MKRRMFNTTETTYTIVIVWASTPILIALLNCNNMLNTMTTRADNDRSSNKKGTNCTLNVKSL